jgi:hypothetical protein
MVITLSICRINIWRKDFQISLVISRYMRDTPDLCSQHSFSFLAIQIRNMVAFGTISRTFISFIHVKRFSFQQILSYAFVTEQKSMKDIVGSKKMENGIVVFFMEKNEKKYESFNYAELVDMKINALDLLERPTSYKVDVPGHKLIVQK